MKTLRLALFFVTFGAASGVLTFAQGTGNGKIDFAEPVQVLSCEPASTVPCFRMKMNLMDDKGAPYGVQMPAADKLTGAMKFKIGDQEVTPFYATAGGTTAAKARSRIALIVVDISGSMNEKLATGETRFESAKRAIRVFLDNFEEGADRVAVVPFESHNVQSQIAGAIFARSKADALAEVDNLPVPGPKNNTALYSSVVFGIQTLKNALPSMMSEASDNPESMVIVLTDGVNEVLKGDDLGLLAGPNGLAEAAQSVKGSGMPVVAIGFTDRGAVDESALRAISSKYYVATDFDALKKIFAFTRTFLNNRLTATFASPFPDRASLAGQTLPISVTLQLPSGQVLHSGEQVWSAPQMGVPVFSGKCSPEEEKAVLTALPPSAGWTSILRPVGVFCGLGLLLIVLWFWVPRLVWPEQHVGIVPSPNAKWASATRIQNGVIQGRPAPQGFQAGPQGAGMRGAGDKTSVNQAVPDFSKTRLANRERGQQ